LATSNPISKAFGFSTGETRQGGRGVLRSVDSSPDPAQLEPRGLVYCTELDTLVPVNNSSVLGKGKRSAQLLGRVKIYVTDPISLEGPKHMVRLSYEIPLYSRASRYMQY